MSTFMVAWWRSDEACRLVLVKRGNKRLRIVVQDHPVHVVQVPLMEERYLEAVEYPVKHAARRMLAFGRHGNATRGALAVLREAAG